MDVIFVPFKVWMVVFSSILVSLAVIAFIYKKMKHIRRREHHEDIDYNWHIPTLGSFKENQYFISKLDPRYKIFALVLFAFGAVSTSHFEILTAFFVTSVLIFILSGLSVLSFLRRLMPVLLFVSILAVIMPLTMPVGKHNTVIVFEHLDFIKIDISAFRIVFKIFIKAFIVLLIMPVLLETSPYPVTIMAMKRLGLPESMAQMLILSYRYIFVFRSEAARMFRSMKLRGFKVKTNLATLMTIGNFLGLLFVRSYERTQRIYEAMVAKGYRGTFPALVNFKAGMKDILFVLAILAVTSMGLMIDRFMLSG